MDRPKLLIEKVMDKEITIHDLPDRPPHCDPRILHAPDECDYCASAVNLQEERRRLDVCNSGRTDRKWPCPVEKARSLVGAHKWQGNAPVKE